MAEYPFCQYWKLNGQEQVYKVCTEATVTVTVTVSYLLDGEIKNFNDRSFEHSLVKQFTASKWAGFLDVPHEMKIPYSFYSFKTALLLLQTLGSNSEILKTG